MHGLSLLEELLKQGTVDRVERYLWRADESTPLKRYIRLYFVGRVHAVWDGPDTPEAMKMIDAARQRP